MSVILMVCFATMEALAGPIVTGSVSASQGMLVSTVSGTNLPAIGSICVTLSYQPTKVAVDDALVQSSVPRTAIGAILDTVARTIEISIIGAGTVQIPDRTDFITMRVPYIGETCDVYAIVVQEVTVVDESGHSHQVELRTGVRQFFAYRPSQGTSGRKRSGTSMPTWNLLGRNMPDGGDRIGDAPVVRIGRFLSSNRVILPEMRSSGERIDNFWD